MCPYCGADLSQSEGNAEPREAPELIFAPMQIIHPPDVGDGAIEAAELFAYSDGDRESALIERTIEDMRHGGLAMADRFRMIMKYLGKSGGYTDQVYKKYILPEMEHGNR